MTQPSLRAWQALSRRPWQALAFAVATLAILAGVTAAGGSAPAVASDPACGDVAVVFARGSGQRLAQREGVALLAGLSERLGDEMRATAYELGSATYGGARYPAVGVGVDSGDAFANLLDAGAYWTGSEGNRYRASVASGVTELRAYLEQRVRMCPTERLVLSGYSQGAQVIGDALPGLSRQLRDRIAFVGLFGDPKLSLPEGRGIFPAGCRGRSLSPWRRGSASCYTDNGILDARTPYVPVDLTKRTGSWCDRDDPICNGNPGDFVHSTHALYAQPGRAVDQAAREAAAAVQKARGEAPAPTPAAALVIDEYWTRPGRAITFDASASALSPTAVASYRWDFDGDGTTDRTTIEPTVDHVYPEPFTGRVRVRLSAVDGAELLTSALVHVDRVGLTAELPSGPADVTVRAAHGADGAIVRWSAGPGHGRVEAWRIHDAAGRLLAHVPAAARQADLAWLPDRTTALTVEAVNEYGSSSPEVAAPRGAGSSRFTAVPAGRRAGGSVEAAKRPNRVVPVAATPPRADDPELATGLVATAATLLVTVGCALVVRILRTGPGAAGGPRSGGRHRRSRRP